MSEKNSEANRRRWSQMIRDILKSIFSDLGKKRWAGKSKKERVDHAHMMNQAKKLRVRSESKTNIIKVNKK